MTVRVCTAAVVTALGLGDPESEYHKAMSVVLNEEGCNVQLRPSLDVVLKGKIIETVRADLLVEMHGLRFAVDIKTRKEITTRDRGRLREYLRVSGYTLGFIVNIDAKEGVTHEAVVA